MVTKLHIVLNQSSLWEAGGIPSDGVSNGHTGHILSVYLMAGAQVLGMQWLMILTCRLVRRALHLPTAEARQWLPKAVLLMRSWL